jgi:hypothetical protein
MMGEVAAAGDVMAGALTARAVEPRAGDAAHGEAQALCLNCGTRLIGEHCHRCGQSAHVHRTAGAIGHDIAHGVFHFEGKIWRTLPMLVLRPGELTRRYVAGERARFVSPLALFLFTVFLMFAVVANLPGWQVGDRMTGGVGMEEAGVELADARLDARADAARLARRLQQLRERPADRGAVRAIAQVEKELAAARKAEADLLAAQRFVPAPDDGPGASAKQAPVARGSLELGGSDAAGSWIKDKYRAAKRNPKLLIYKIKTSAYKYSWALIPISLPFIWLLFPLRRGVGLYDHAVFATYSLSFMSLLVVALSLVAAVGAPPGPITTAALLIPPLHVYKQLKGGYGLSRAGALWRTAWMLVFTAVTSTLFITLLVYLGTTD